MPADLETVWTSILDEFRRANPPLVRAWFRGLEAQSLSTGNLVIGAQNAAQVRYLTQNCQTALIRAAQQVTGRLISVRFVELNSSQTTLNEPEKKHGILTQIAPDPTHTFDSFVVSPVNRLAHAAALAIAEDHVDSTAPPSAAPLLVLVGPQGVGKTHLFHAIAHRVANQTAPVCFTSCDALVDLIIRAIETNESDRLRDECLSLSLLLVDDIHELANRERSQEEFFHLFDRLLRHQTRIVLTSNVPPKEMTGIHDRLVSRFASGLVVGLAEPDVETKVTITLSHARARCIELARPMAEIVARSIHNLHELPALLTRLNSLSQLRSQPIDTAMISEALGAPPA